MTRQSLSPTQLLSVFVRRMLDVAIALTALIIVTPAIIIIVFAIKIDSPGPIFFSQVRLGRDGRHFRLHKFRKFNHHLPSAGRDLTLRNDARMTRVGRCIERTKLDELPQLWNVLVGEMSIVGPRPESLAFADCFTGSYRRILDHTPGLFGPNQVFFRNEWKSFPADQDPHEFYRKVLFPSKARNDLAYFSQRRFRSDVVWIFRGMLAVFGLFMLMGQGLDAAVRDATPADDHSAAADATALEPG